LNKARPTKQPKSSPDKLLAEGNNRLRKLVKPLRDLIFKITVITIQTIKIVITVIRKTDFWRERNLIKGQNKLNRVVILHAPNKTLVGYKEFRYNEQCQN